MDQYKTSKDLEIFEMNYIDNTHLQEVCQLRQPILFDFLPVDPIFMLYTGSDADVNVKDTNKYYTSTSYDVDPVVVTYDCANQLFANDENSHFFSEDNSEFLENTGLMKHIVNYNELLAPNYYTIHTEYDYLFGSPNTMVPLRHHTHYRRFLYVLSGKIRIKMTSWKNTPYINNIRDYENYDFRSPISPENIFLNKKIKFLDIEVTKGLVIYLPPYMWYSIQYLDADSRILSISYTTAMNAISNAHHLGLYWLQQHNIVKMPTNTKELDKEVDKNELIEESNQSIEIDNIEIDLSGNSI